MSRWDLSNTLGATSSANYLSCTSGSYCESSALTTPTSVCSAGWFCVAGTSQSKPSAGPCPAGSYCPSGSSAATSCAAGTYQSMTMQGSCITCPAGHYCDGASPTAPVDCLAGRYCLAGTNNQDQYQCASGTYNSLVGMVSASACLACPGKYCAGPGLSTTSGPCNAGYYCVRSASGPYCTCPRRHMSRGSLCPLGSSTPLLCPAGRYCSTTGLSVDEGPCDPGSICILGSNTKNSQSLQLREVLVLLVTTARVEALTQVPVHWGPSTPTLKAPRMLLAKHAQRAFTVIIPVPQPSPDLALLGTTASQASTQTSLQPHCILWESTVAGSSGPGLPGNTAGVDCPAGTYNKLKGQTVCFPCPAGFKCEGASALPLPCDQGKFCSGSNSSATQVQCVAGTYNPYTGRSVCVTFL